MPRERSGSVDLEPLAILIPIEGWDSWVSPYSLKDTFLTNLSNLEWRTIAGALTLVKGRDSLATFASLSFKGLGRFSNATSTGPRTVAVLSDGSWRVIDDAGVAATPTLVEAWSGTAKTRFVTFSRNNLLIASNGTQRAQKLRKDNLTATTRVGIDAPTAAPTVAAGAAGNLSGKYQWRVTFESATHESSPGPVSSQLTLTGQQADLTGVPTSTDTQVTKRNIYRIGGTVPEWRFVGSINDNSTTTFTDNIADVNLGETLGFDRDPPPTEITQFIEHKQRLLGIAGNKIYISNYQEPEGWNVANYLTVGGASDILAAASTGSVALILKDTEAFMLAGESLADFVLLPIAKVGVLAPDSVVSAEGVVLWLAHDGVRSFDGRTIQYIGQEVRTAIEQVPLSTRRQAVGVFASGMYLLSFPSQFTLLYDLVTGKWSKLSWTYDFAISAFDDNGLGRFIHTNQPSGSTLVSWPGSGYTDLGSPITWNFSRSIFSGQEAMGGVAKGAFKSIKRWREVEIIAPPQSISISLELVVDGDTTNKSYSTTVSLADAPKRVGLPPNMVGKSVKITVSGTHSAYLEIHGVILWGYLERSYGPSA